MDVYLKKKWYQQLKLEITLSYNYIGIISLAIFHLKIL